MIADITPENEKFIESAVANGLFQDRGQAMNAAVELLKRRERLVRDVNSGIVQLEKGLGRSFDIDSIMAQIDARLDGEGR